VKRHNLPARRLAGAASAERFIALDALTLASARALCLTREEAVMMVATSSQDTESGENP